MKCPGLSRRGPEGLWREVGLEPKANTTPSSWCLARPDSAAFGCGGGNWGFGQLGSSLRSQAEERAQPSSSNHHMGLFCTRPGAGGQNLRPCFPSLQGLSAWKETLLCYLWFFGSFSLWKWRGNNNNNNLLWVWEYPCSGGARVSRWS